MMIFFLLINFILSFANANQFTKFNTYNNMAISNQSQPLLKLKNSFQVSKYSSDKSCLLACSAASNCAVATIEENICTLFNNQTVLINTIYSDSVKLFSKNEMKTCLDGYYANFTSMVCLPKKLNGIGCLSTEECLSSAGLECSNGKCLCPSTEYK